MAYDPDKATRICELLAAQDDGCASLRQCCKQVDVAPSTFLFWCDQYPDLAEQYARADKIAADVQFARFHELNEQPAPQVEGRADTGWVQWQRMRLDNQKWAMSKRRPSKYGDRIEHTGPGGGAIQIMSSVPRPPKEEE